MQKSKSMESNTIKQTAVTKLYHLLRLCYITPSTVLIIRLLKKVMYKKLSLCSQKLEFIADLHLPKFFLIPLSH